MQNPSSSKEMLESLISLGCPPHLTEKEFYKAAEHISKLYKSGDAFYFNVTVFPRTFIGSSVKIFYDYISNSPCGKLSNWMITGIETGIYPIGMRKKVSKNDKIPYLSFKYAKLFSF